MSAVRDNFVSRFGEADAVRIEDAAEQHKNGIHDNKGSDPFKWAILICVGHECLSRYREEHSITATEDEVREWAVEHGELGSHDGDCDYIALMCGVYQGWLPAEVEA